MHGHDVAIGLLVGKGKGFNFIVTLRIIIMLTHMQSLKSRTPQLSTISKIESPVQVS